MTIRARARLLRTLLSTSINALTISGRGEIGAPKLPALKEQNSLDFVRLAGFRMLAHSSNIDSARFPALVIVDSAQHPL